MNPIVDMGAYEFCRGDTNRDGTVDVADLVNVILEWGCTGDAGPCAGDVDGSGSVDVSDLVTVIVNWGACD